MVPVVFHNWTCGYKWYSEVTEARVCEKLKNRNYWRNGSNWRNNSTHLSKLMMGSLVMMMMMMIALHIHRKHSPGRVCLFFISYQTFKGRDVAPYTTLWVKKHDTKLLPITSPNVNRFLKFFTGRFTGEFAANLCLNIWPHLTYVTLPCEIRMSENWQ